MKFTKQQFLKGINRRFSRKDSISPEFFWTLQNARIYSRGDTGKVVRIKGYEKFNNSDTDYSKTLDIISFRDKFVVFYEDVETSGKFWVDVLDLEGNVRFSDSYVDRATTTGQLTQTENTVYIAPHNKILFFNGEEWFLSDFIPTVPDVLASADGAGTPAEGSIEMLTGAVETSEGSKATGRIEVLKNNIPIGQEHTWTIEIGGKTSNPITTHYKDSESDIAMDIYQACSNSPISDDYDLYYYFGSVSTDMIFTPGPPVVRFVKKTVGYSTDVFTIDSEFNIVGDDKTGGSTGGGSGGRLNRGVGAGDRSRNGGDIDGGGSAGRFGRGPERVIL